MIRRILFLVAVLSSLVCAETSRTSVLVIYDSDDTYALSCFEQAVVTFEYNRIPYATYDLAASPTLPALDQFTAVVTATEMLWKLDAGSCAALRSYVENGGGMAVLYRGWHPELSPLLGITATAAPLVSEKKSKGLKFIRELLPGINGTEIAPSILGDISSYDIQLLPGASVFAVTAEGKYPVGWVVTHGRGRVIVWNTVILSEKIYRGFIIPSLGAVGTVTLSPILNVGAICMDDFPNASPTVKIEPVKTEFNMTVSEFYTFRWYPDMLRLAKQYGLKYTAGLIFSYAESTSPPYKFSEWVSSTVERAGKTINSSVWITREAQKDIEIAFHGHNHQPLTLNNWHTPENMKLSLSAAKRRWQYDNLAPAPVSYIPPMNIIDSVGMRALTDIFPTIRSVGGQYMGAFAKGQNREFGTEPWNPSITAIPRVTSGFIYDDFNKLLTISILNTVGAWTHFVHPDDILATSGRYAENTRDDISPENLQWRGEPNKTGIYYSFQRWVAFVKQFYPWLHYTDYQHAHADVARYQASSVVVKAAGRQLSVRVNIVPNYFTVHVGAGNAITSCAGGEIVQSSTLAYSTLYVIRAVKNDLSISLRDPVPAFLYRAGTPRHLYLAGDSRYLASGSRQIRYPSSIATIAPIHAALAQRKAETRILPAHTAAPDRRAARTAETGPAQLTLDDTSRARSIARDYVAMDKKEKAIPIYEQLLARYPDNAGWWKELYQLYSWSERPVDAVRALAQYVRTTPSDYESMKTLAELYVGLERQKEAIPLYERLVERRPDDRSLRTMLFQLYVWNDLHERAGRAYEYLYATDARDTASAMKAVQEYQAAGRGAEAERIIEELAGRFPGDLVLQKKLGQLYIWQERQADAIRVYERIVREEPDSIAPRLTLARLYLWNKRPLQAAIESKRILRRDASNLEALRMAAEGDRANENWFDARAWYSAIADRSPHDTEAREYLDAVRRDHGLHFTTAYERIDDSNNLMREELPVSIQMYQSHTADYYFRMTGRRVRSDHGEEASSLTGYGAGFGARFSLGKATALSFEALATGYDTHWAPLTAAATFEHAFREGFSLALNLERAETVEGIQALDRRLYTTSAKGELFLQATSRWSLGALGQIESYSDENMRSTGALVTSFRIVLHQPELTLQASSIYQDTKHIYPTSEPYWTPRELFTTSLGGSISYTLFGVFTPEVTEAGTVQGGVFSNNLGAKATIQLSQFLQLSAEYGKTGSSVYRQTVARASLRYRY